MLRYHSTRSTGKTVTASQAILQGLAEDGGYVGYGGGIETREVNGFEGVAAGEHVGHVGY